MDDKNRTRADTILQNEKSLELLTISIAHQAAEIIDQQSSRLRNRTAIITTLFVLALGTTLGASIELLRNSISETARISASSEFAANFSMATESPIFRDQILEIGADRLSDLDKEIEEIRNTILVKDALDAVNQGGSFSDAEARAAIESLNKISSGQNTLLPIDDALRSIVLSFASATRFDFIAELDDSFSEFFLGDLDVVQTMVQALGIEIASTIGDPQQYTGRIRDDWEQLERQFDLYANASRNLGYPEFPIIYEILLSTLRGDVPEQTAVLVKSLQGFKEDERETAGRLAIALITSSYTREPEGQKAKTAAARTSAIFKDYADFDETGLLGGIVETFVN